MSDSNSDIEMVKKACQELHEHFDTVQIFCTRHEAYEKDGTVNVNWGSGNWFARYGQIGQWMVQADEDQRIGARKSQE